MRDIFVAYFEWAKAVTQAWLLSKNGQKKGYQEAIFFGPYGRPLGWQLIQPDPAEFLPMCPVIASVE